MSSASRWARTPATIDDLYREAGKAELIKGRIVCYTPHGDRPSEAVGEIVVSLHEYVRQTGVGLARGANVGYALPAPLPSGRQSFCPDASYHTGPRPTDPMRFFVGAPTFAVEVRGEDDYGSTREQQIARKRGDYFRAGTLVVWDVDALAERVTSYRHDARRRPVTFHRGDVADAEPAVPGWRPAVDDFFP